MARREMDKDHKFVLDQQVSELHKYREEERQLSMEEAALMRKQWDLEREEAAKVEALRRGVMEAAQQELHQFNHHKRDQLAASVAEEREADLARLQASNINVRPAEGTAYRILTRAGLKPERSKL